MPEKVGGTVGLERAPMEHIAEKKSDALHVTGTLRSTTLPDGTLLISRSSLVIA
jgi:hypothetical protein